MRPIERTNVNTPTTSDPTQPTRPGREEHRMPRWVRGFVVVAVAAAILLSVALAIGSGDHGPSRHVPGDVEGKPQTPEGHTPPVDHG